MTDIKLNDKLAIIEKTLQDFKNCKTFLKDKNTKINELLKLAFDLYENHNDKGGFLRLLFEYDKTNGWSKASTIKKDITDYLDFCDIDYIFSIKKQKLYLDYNKKDIVDFLTYKKEVLAIEKENKENEKTSLLNVKLPFKLTSLKEEDLKACILQCKEVLKTLKEKEKQK